MVKFLEKLPKASSFPDALKNQILSSDLQCKICYENFKVFVQDNADATAPLEQATANKSNQVLPDVYADDDILECEK